MAIGQAVEPPAKGDPSLRWMSDEQLLGLFVSQGSQPAFEALVERHGPRVLGVCRQILRRPHDAEDIFQATFLLLARKAGTIRKGQSVGHWLRGVAHRLAVRSKVQATRRSGRERGGEGAAMVARHFEDDNHRRELERIVHEEVDRLPERLRQPVLLCYLDGLSNDAAARQLGCPSSTLKERLARAREVLHGRLARRGLALTVALLLLLLPRTTPAEDVPFRLMESTVSTVMADARRRGLVRKQPRIAACWLTPLPLLALATFALAAGVSATLYLASPERLGFFTWFLGAVRKACHQ